MNNELRPLRIESDYEWALAEIDKVLHAELGTPEGDRLELLTSLVHDYERVHHPIPAPSPRAIVEFMLDQGQITPAEIQAMLAKAA